MSIKRNLALNGSAVVAQKLVLALQHLVLVPFFLHGWGAAQYGEWLTLGAIPSALAFCNLGLGSACANSFVLRFLGGDERGAARAMRAGQRLLALTMVLGALLAMVVFAVLWTLGLFARMQVGAGQALAVAGLLVAASLVGFYNQLNDGWFRAARRAHLGVWIETLGALVRIGVFIGLLLGGAGLIPLALAELGIALATSAGLFLGGRRLVGVEMRVQLERGELVDFAKKGLAFMMEPIRRAIYLEGAIVVLRIGVGPEGVALFGTLRTLGNSVAQMYNSIQATSFPELQGAMARGALATARRIFCLSLGLTGALTGAGLVALAVAGGWIYRHWTGGLLDAPQVAWWLVLAGIAANAAWWPAAAVFRAADRPEGYAICGIACSLAGVLIATALVAPFGLPGVLLGLLVMELMMAAYVLPKSCALLGEPLWRLPADILALRHDLLAMTRRKVQILTRRS